uniref:Uncharacterized protein n=1 Tax=Palisada sp. TaxID=1955416 RepID=A0A1Z1MSE1_9FLOR|nr:hypothetical protein [Palisada sp.]
MNLTLDFFAKNFQGRWFTQTNTYLLGTKRQKLHLKELNILITKIKDKGYIIKKDNRNTLLNIYNKDYDELLRIYKANNLNNRNIVETNIGQIENNLFKVNYINIKNKYNYEEYIYLIHTNLMFSVGILKNRNNYSYYGIIITSYIKLKS